ncbi:polymer-forming cytoskeletal protein [Pseudorhodoferax sp. Leaf265]|uniref:bactofilin family protein n=1 Tax=Pseudorhodoferax sp. Leaf265 TaxID=1736315 RepID=UPI0006F9B147|nr:polymer-forming cytoskeletal protein [Pseudorhodoferax sp. Leaf265]KQP15639.1 cell shape determination protein CcmA [Pseudorhodoferax sp. Leaf265]
MALQSPFFGKRENEPLNTRPSTFNNSSALQPSSSSPTSSSSNMATSATSPSVPGSSASAPVSAAMQEPGSKLIVGPNIKLKGVEITDCDTLVVEGTVEATMDSRMMQIAEQGAFKGSAEVDLAEIRGAFDGDLVVREKLVIYATGKVSGKIRYGKVVIEEGGQISGEISFGAGAAKSSKPALAAA